MQVCLQERMMDGFGGERTSWRNHVGANVVLDERGSELLHNMCDGRFTSSVCVAREWEPIECTDAARRNDLARLLEALLIALAQQS